MHPRVLRLPKPQPDYRQFLRAVRREQPDRVPLIELAVHAKIVANLLDQPVAKDQATAAVDTVKLLHRLGYDVVKVSAPIPFAVARAHASAANGVADDRDWQDQHRGPIGDMAAFDAFRWPTPADVDFQPVDAAAAALPDGMKLIGFCGGVLEFTLDLIGMERFMYAVYDAPELIEAVIDRVGRLLCGVFEAYCKRESVCAIWLGDDLGGKSGLLVSPDLLRRLVFPWYRRFVELAHRYDRPFLLHSCGRTETVMADLIVHVGIDAKHSFEDSIEPVEMYFERWGKQVGVLGGIDVNLLSRGSEEAVRRRVREVLECAADFPGYACGSGNSITDYVPVENYLAMIETVKEWESAKVRK